MERTELHERIIEEAKLLPPGDLARLLEYIARTDKEGGQHEN